MIHERMDRLGYEALIPQIVPSDARLPAVAVDFGARLRKPDGTTDCARLDRLIAAVARLRPKAIAVDYDFGRDADGKANAGADQIAIETYRKDHPPLYLASLSVGLDPSYWLAGGDPAFAVHPYLPSDGGTGQVYLVGDLKVGSQPAMPGMMSRLAEFAPQRRPNPILRLLATDEAATDVETPAGGAVKVVAKRYLFNPSTLDRVKRETVDATKHDPGEEARAAIQDRIVVIGSSSDLGDRHGRPDRAGEKEFGIHMHAAGVAAFSGERLVVFHRPVSLALDLIAGFAIVAGVQAGLWRQIHLKHPLTHDQLAQISALVAAAVVVALGLAIARGLNVLWMDFLFVAAVAALHPAIDRAVAAARKRLRHENHDEGKGERGGEEAPAG